MHRDISSAIIHLLIVLAEIEGAIRAGTVDALEPSHTRAYSATDIVRFYRPSIYLHTKFLEPGTITLQIPTLNIIICI